MTDPVTCPNCRDHLDIPAELRGRPVRCATCQTVFTVPDHAGGEPPVARPSRANSRGRQRHPDDRRPRRYSNGVVWFLLFGTALVCGGLSLFCGGVLVWAYNPPMQVHKSEEGRFQVEFPGEPQPFSQIGEKGVPVRGMESRPADGELRFFVKYYDLPKKRPADGGDGEAVLTETMKAEIAALAGGTEIQRATTTHAGFPALDVQVEQDTPFAKRNTVLRVVLAGARVYVLGAQGQNQPPQVWYVRRFFISFQPAEKAKPASKPGE